MKRILSSATLIALALLVAPAAFADYLKFVGPNDSGYASYQQQANSPCVIGDNSCKQGGFVFTNGTGMGNADDYDAASPAYSLVDLQKIIGAGVTTFSMGIDDNVAAGQGTDTLIAFKVWACDGCASFAGAYTKNGGGSPLPTGFTEVASTDPAKTYPISYVNGNGASDAILTGFNLTGSTSTTTFIFEAIVDPSSDGMEEFFLVHAGTAIPEPASIGLFGTILIAAGYVVRKRRRA